MERPIAVSRILYPRSVAVIGASEDERKFGGRICRALVHHAFQGSFLPINPVRPTIFGVPTHPSIDRVKAPVDLALIAVPVEQLYEVVEACGKAGVGACIIISAKLAEFDDAGAELQRRLVTLADRYRLRLIGPNCMGIINPQHALALSSTATLTSVDRLLRGGVAFASQSGALLGTLLMLAHAHGVGFSALVSVGNQADLELCDFLEALIDDAATTTICLYVEAFKDAQRFRTLALRAWQAGKPLLLVKAGRTQAGQLAARSHTASLAGSYAAFSALADASGALVLDEPEGMALTAGFFDKSRDRLRAAGAGGISLIVSSGGGGAILADRLALAELPLAQWHEDTRGKLDKHFLPAHAHNPIDLGGHKGAASLSVFVETIDAITDDPNTTVVTYLLTPQPMMMETAQALIAAYRRSSKPFLIIADIAGYVPDVRAHLTDSGIPIVSRVDDALRIFAALFRWLGTRDRPPQTPQEILPPRPTLAPLAEGPLTEQAAKTLLRAYGIATNRESFADDAAAATTLAADFGYPVVLKGSSKAITHKSDLGLVRLGLHSAPEVRAAFEALRTLGAPFDDFRITVAEQIALPHELVIGARYDAEYGPLVIVGFGGVLVEAVQDFAIAPAPLERAQAFALIEKLRLYPVLNGLRGRTRADLDALADALVRLSWIAHDFGPQLAELEVNPLLVGTEGQGAVAVDARGTIAPTSINLPPLSDDAKVAIHE